MRRIVLPLVAAFAATALILGPGRSLLPGPLRMQVTDVSLTAPALEHDSHAAASPAGAGTAAVAAPPLAPSAARVGLVIRPAQKATQGYALGVHLVAPDGKVLNETPVRYYEIVDLFGQREMFIGETATDGQGDASLVYLPAQPGPHQIIARSPGRGTATRGETRVTFEATVAAPTYRTEPAPLAAFSAALPYGVGAIVLLVWALLALAFFGTARGVVAGARDKTRKKGDIA